MRRLPTACSARAPSSESRSNARTRYLPKDWRSCPGEEGVTSARRRPPAVRAARKARRRRRPFRQDLPALRPKTSCAPAGENTRTPACIATHNCSACMNRTPRACPDSSPSQLPAGAKQHSQHSVHDIAGVSSRQTGQEDDIEQSHTHNMDDAGHWGRCQACWALSVTLRRTGRIAPPSVALPRPLHSPAIVVTTEAPFGSRHCAARTTRASCGPRIRQRISAKEKPIG